MTKRHPRLNAFEALPKEARIITQAVLDLVRSRSCTLVDAYASLREQLAEIGIPNENIRVPTFSSFHRLIITGRPVWKEPSPEIAEPRHLSISENTCRLLGAALRALADDLEGRRSQPATSSPHADPLMERAEAIARETITVEARHVYVPGIGHIYVPRIEGSNE